MRRALVWTGLATALAALVGGRSSRQGVESWYPTIRKPGYVPPNAVFPIAWTVLYVDIAAASAAAIERFREDGDNAEARGYAAALGANLILNAGWSWVFFGKRKPAPAAVAAAVLAVSSTDLARRAAVADPKLGAVLAPYPLWCTFAAVMSADIWRLNR